MAVYGLKGGPRLVDDIVISAELTAIDGTGGILGQAGPTSVRTGSYLPGAIDLEGDYLLPGLVELHTDNFERHLMPRPKTRPLTSWWHYHRHWKHGWARCRWQTC